MEGALFKGERVYLAARRPDDAEAFSRWSANPAYMRLMDTEPVRPLPTEAFAAPDRQGAAPDYNFRIRTLADDALIGFVALHSFEWSNGVARLSIGIGDPAYWGKGYGTDALRIVLRYAFDELNLYRVGLDVIAYNTRAIRAYEKVGFTREGAIRGAVLRDGQRYDSILMGILREEWRALQGA